VKAAYTSASWNQLWNSVKRRGVEPEPDDLPERKSFLNSRRLAGGAALLLVGNAVAQALASDDRQQQPAAAPGTPTPTPTPTTTPSSGPAQPGQPTTPATPPTQPTAPSTPPASPAQVIVQAGDPRRSTLWGIAKSHEDTLLTPAEIDTARRRGGADAVVLDALEQLFQLNPQRGFRPELMDGVATALHGDPDTIQPGWKITVEKPAG
jgi:hypothetical protein